MPAESLAVDHLSALMVDISESHLFALIRTGRFGPRATRLGRCCRYSTAELAAWVATGCPPRHKWKTFWSKG
jgi:predicted DNA-binding transcriptional regulator AlpA